VWAANGTLLHVLAGHHSYINSAVWTRDGERLLTASSDSTTKLWDARVGVMIASLDGSATGIYRASFSADETAILTAGWDGSARIWRPRSGRAGLDAARPRRPRQ